MRDGDNDPRAADPLIPRCCCCGATSDQGTFSLVHLRLTPRFPIVWLQRGRAPRAWWRSYRAAWDAAPVDADAGAHYLCPACLPLARSTPSGAPVDALEAPAPFPPDDVPTPVSYNMVHAASGREGVGNGLSRHILTLRQVFGQAAMVNGATQEGHRGIELIRGSATVRCRACGWDIARVADLAGATTEDEPLYEYTLAGLRACPAPSMASGANDRERGDGPPAHRTSFVLSHPQGSTGAVPATLI